MSYLYDYDDANQLQEIFSGTFQSRDEGDFTTSVETFAYDDDGNMIESDDGTNTNTFSWDTFDRLVAVEKQPADETVLQYYDIGGLRKLKTAADGTETRSHFSGLPTVSEVETPSAGSPVEISYFMGHQLLGFDRGGDFRFFLTDGLSSVRVVVDGADGSQLAYYEYDEFGQQIAYSGSVVSPKTYVGGLGVHDDTADTGLLYMRARHYDPANARFLSRDPIGFAGGLNLYGYVGGNPVNHLDPRGLDPSGGTFTEAQNDYYRRKWEGVVHRSLFSDDEYRLINQALAIVNHFAPEREPHDGDSRFCRPERFLRFSKIFPRKGSSYEGRSSAANTDPVTGNVYVNLEFINSIKDSQHRKARLVRALANELYHVRYPQERDKWTAEPPSTYLEEAITNAAIDSKNVSEGLRKALLDYQMAPREDY